MKSLTKKRLAIATAVYWFLLVYIVAALVWWFIALGNQNTEMTQLRLQNLEKTDPEYNKKRNLIEEEKQRKTTQYIGEGVTFLALILVGALFVYRAVLRQIKLQQQHENFMMAVTHELKTPIAVAKLNLETLQKHHLDTATQQKLIQMIMQETERLNTLTSNILVSAQLEGGRYRLSKEDLNLSDLVKSSVVDFKTRYPERKLDIQIEQEIDLKGDSLLLQILVNNLLENAVKYSPKEKRVIVGLTKRSNIILEIIDEGSGIKKQERKRIFEKFYRVGNEETRTTKGTGLGLYLCKKIANDHNADILVTENTPSGTIFTVFFHT